VEASKMYVALMLVTQMGIISVQKSLNYYLKAK
jgi:hypothetical protein